MEWANQNLMNRPYTFLIVLIGRIPCNVPTLSKPNSFNPDNTGSMLLQNMGIKVWHHMVSKPRRPPNLNIPCGRILKAGN